MATVLNDKKTKLKIVVVTGKKEDGSDRTAERVFNNANPEVTNDDMYNIATQIGAMQEYTVEKYVRIDEGELAPEE